MLILSRTPTQSIMIGDDIKVTILDVKGHQVRIGIEAPKSIPVNREEIWERIQAEKGEQP